MGEPADPRLAELVFQYADCFSVRGDGRVRCELNGHVFPAAGALDAVAEFVAGHRFKRLRNRRKSEAWVAKLDPFLVPSTNFPGKLWCRLTRQLLALDRDTAKRHMQGRKFVNAQERFQNDEQFLFDEPDMQHQEEDEEEIGSGDCGNGMEVSEATSKKGSGSAKGKKPQATSGNKKNLVKGSKKAKKSVEEATAGFWVPDWAPDAAASASDDSEAADAEEEEAEEQPQPAKQWRREASKGGSSKLAGQTRTSKKAKRPQGPNQVVDKARDSKGSKKQNPNKHKAKRPRAR